MPFYIVTRRSVAEAASQQEALDITGPGEPRDPRAVVTDVRVQAMETNEAAWREINEAPPWGPGDRQYRTKSGRVLSEALLDALAEEAERGYCIEPSPDGGSVCGFAPGHEGAHSWEARS